MKCKEALLITNLQQKSLDICLMRSGNHRPKYDIDNPKKPKKGEEDLGEFFSAVNKVFPLWSSNRKQKSMYCLPYIVNSIMAFQTIPGANSHNSIRNDI